MVVPHIPGTARAILAPDTAWGAGGGEQNSATELGVSVSRELMVIGGV